MNTKAAAHTPTPDGFEGDRKRAAEWERMLLRDSAHVDLVAAAKLASATLRAKGGCTAAERNKAVNAIRAALAKVGA